MTLLSWWNTHWKRRMINVKVAYCRAYVRQHFKFKMSPVFTLQSYLRHLTEWYTSWIAALRLVWLQTLVSSGKSSYWMEMFAGWLLLITITMMIMIKLPPPHTPPTPPRPFPDHKYLSRFLNYPMSGLKSSFSDCKKHRKKKKMSNQSPIPSFPLSLHGSSPASQR